MNQGAPAVSNVTPELPSPKKEEEINPLLKLALELGPLMVFSLVNSRGAIGGAISMLGELGGLIFIVTGPLYGRDNYFSGRVLHTDQNVAHDASCLRHCGFGVWWTNALSSK